MKYTEDNLSATTILLLNLQDIKISFFLFDFYRKEFKNSPKIYVRSRIYKFLMERNRKAYTDVQLESQ